MQAIRAAIFLNPLFISLFPDISKRLVDFVTSKNELKNNSEFLDYKVSTVAKSELYKEEKTIRVLLEYTKANDTSPILNDAGRTIGTTQNYINNFNNCLAASEIMRYFIDKNKIDLIIEFLDTMIESKSCTNPSTISFEGFYINHTFLFSKGINCKSSAPALAGAPSRCLYTYIINNFCQYHQNQCFIGLFNDN